MRHGRQLDPADGPAFIVYGPHFWPCEVGYQTGPHGVPRCYKHHDWNARPRLLFSGGIKEPGPAMSRMPRDQFVSECSKLIQATDC